MLALDALSLFLKDIIRNMRGSGLGAPYLVFLRIPQEIYMILALHALSLILENLIRNMRRSGLVAS